MNTIKSKNNREFDIIIYGASSFTGKIILDYFVEKYPPHDSFRWAIAGRNKTKLEKLTQNLDFDIPIFIADSHDRQALDDLSKKTKVILTTVGPYAKYGADLVFACSNNGTDYCDLAGETQWIRKMIDDNHELAKTTGARIISACGFDSVPFDLGVYYMQNHAINKINKPLEKIITLVRAMRGGASGGTIASIINIIIEGKRNREIARIVSNPYALNPEGMREGPEKRDLQTFVFNKKLKTWTSPFIMASINTRIVRRTNALLNYPYGKSFSYTEYTDCGNGVSGAFKSFMMTTFLGLFMMFTTFEFSRKNIIQKFLPKPGEGPNKTQQKNGFFKLFMHGLSSSGETLKMKITGNQDPGYGSTSKMISEVAICLALDEVKTEGGIWTPASALGEKLLNRLEKNAGMTFEMMETE